MFEKLFTPLQIRGLELKNRVILPAMGTKFAGKASYVTQQLIDYHVARVKGGCGLNMVGFVPYIRQARREASCQSARMSIYRD